MLNCVYRAAYVRALMLSETLRRLVIRGVLAFVALISPVVMADDDLAGMGVRVAEGAKSAQSSGIIIIQVVGFFAFAGGFLSIKAMKNNPQIKPWMVILAIVVGAMMMGIPEIVKRGMTQIGLTPVSVS